MRFCKLQENICMNKKGTVKMLAWIVEMRYDITFILEVGSSLGKNVYVHVCTAVVGSKVRVVKWKTWWADLD